MSVDRNRLAQLLGMLGSNFDGEIVNAGRLAVRLVKDARVTWSEPLDGERERVATEAARVLLAENEQLQTEKRQLQEELTRLRRPPLPTTWTLPQTPGEQIAQALAWVAITSDWEREFITDMSERWRPPTEKQQAVLDPNFHKDCRPCTRQGAGAMISTTFSDKRGLDAYNRQDATVEELAEFIKATTREAQDKLPLVKLALFGEKRTDKGCLRHDANVTEITGLEADYDGGATSVEEAAEIARQTGLNCIIYTSPSYTVQKPRWRLLTPFSKGYPPEPRSALRPSSGALRTARHRVRSGFVGAIPKLFCRWCKRVRAVRADHSR